MHFYVHSYASLGSYHRECVRAGTTGEASNTSVLLHHVIPEVTLAMALGVVVCASSQAASDACTYRQSGSRWHDPGVRLSRDVHVLTVGYTEAVGCRQDHHSSELLKRCDSQAIRLAQVCFCNSTVTPCPPGLPTANRL